MASDGLPSDNLELSSSVANIPVRSTPARFSGDWAIFSSTFITIFLAEIGDKTQVTTLLMTAESHNPWVVFAGAGTALVLTSLLGVLVGQWLAQRITPRTLERSAGISLLVIAVLLIWEVFQS
ncbi:MAG: TMEM165/GDT1 family protein [Oscillatoriales cyanobacterium RM2_1_1]|nr:TMEM165/GDT1 family protein [Oscillatoriales cyanobacterium SM2_3_0]NJO47652.1 TMEM165/GDT1 family protein [Oscillatoriales cyanobacterium RM2_1_1]